jgi:hypothetical protein
MRYPYRRFSGLGLLAVGAALGLVGCGASSTPHVASLGNSGGSTPGATTTTLPKGNPTQLLDEWASCQRSHGDPTQVDPTIDANGVIHITFPASVSGNGPVGLGPKGGPNGPCDAYLTAASTALNGGHQPTRPDPAKLAKYAQCMRANGVPDFPDPSSGGLSIRISPGSDLNPQSPTFQSASKLCAKRTGVPGIGGPPPRGAIQATSGTGPAGGPGGKSGSGSAGIATSGGAVGG